MNLPSGVLDWTFSRLYHPAGSQKCRSQVLLRRYATAVRQRDVPKYSPPALYPHISSGSNSVLTPKRVKRRELPASLRPHTGEKMLTELGSRMEALEEVIETKEDEPEPPTFSEDELLAIYEDLLASPDAVKQHNPPSQPQILAPEELSIVDAADQRLRLDTSLNRDMVPGLLDRISPQSSGSSKPALVNEPSLPAYQRVLLNTEVVVGRLEDNRVSGTSPLPIAILSGPEWNAVVAIALQSRDNKAVEHALDLMNRTRVPMFEEQLQVAMTSYADAGDVESLEHCLSRFVSGAPNEELRHLHIKAHLKAAPPNTMPTSALSVLHHYESKNIPAAMKTYSKTIRYLFTVRSSTSQAHAWDLFTHMRYVAHPKPDAFLYTQMIRACASPYLPAISSEPERALDLWTEMVHDSNLPPTTAAYNAIILACARSGEKTYVNEAFRLAKEMFDSHRDAFGKSAYEPDRKTFCALLEGAKRLGDLARARLILAEMVRREVGPNSVDEEVMMHVFHTYAAYRPPFTPSMAPLVTPQEESATTPSPNLEKRHLASANQPQDAPRFGYTPPQTETEIIEEVEILFQYIFDHSRAQPPAPYHKFRDVTLTPRLLNSYLSVYYKHASLEDAERVFWTIFEQCGVERTHKSYLEALERCTNANKFSRTTALLFGQRLFTKWEEIEDAEIVDPRIIERVRVAYIRLLTINNLLDDAVHQVRSFFFTYPPSNVREPPPKPSFRANRTSLAGQRPLVRTTSVTDVPDDFVPPLLAFSDLNVLHSRLVGAEMAKEIGFVKFVCKSYEGHLRARRERGLNAKPQVEHSNGNHILAYPSR